MKKNQQSKNETKRYEATIYCKNCMRVTNVLIAQGTTLTDSDCAYCRVRYMLFPVITYPGKKL